MFDDAAHLKALPKLFAMIALFIAALSIGHEVFAAEPIDADGPDFVESSEVIGKDRFQYEADMMSARDYRAPELVQTMSTPVLLKYGTSDTTEVRVETDGYIRNVSDSANPPQTGIGDSALGLKWHSQDREEMAGKAAISWILHFDIPSGTKEFTRPGIRPSLRSVITWDLPRDFALGLMPGIKYDTDSGGRRFTSGILGVVLNRRVNEKFRAFVEMSAPQLAYAQDGGTVVYWDMGAAYLLTMDSQLGGRVGVAANRNTPSNYWLMELAQRF